MKPKEDKQKSRKVYYALFKAHPASNPPFDIELGFAKNDKHILKDCQHIPDGVNRIEEFCQKNEIEYSKTFTLIYPIYLEAMDTSNESTMHSIAWMVKEQADAKKWNFDRIGGYTGKNQDSFLL